MEAKFANQDLALKPGMFATARILLNGSSMGIFLPRAAILTDPSTNSSQVFFVRDGKARVAVVQLGAVDGDMIQILSGITADFVVATNHLQDLFDGEPVDTVTAAPGRRLGAVVRRRRSIALHKLAELCVKRPVFATMLIVALMVVGGFSFFTLGVDLFPKIDLPTVSVSVSNPGRVGRRSGNRHHQANRRRRQHH